MLGVKHFILRLVSAFVVFASVSLASGPASSSSSESLSFETDVPNPATREGTLYLPEGVSGKVPAVVVVHGTNGPDGRYNFHRDSLLDAGIATFEVDFKSGVFSGPSDRPHPTKFVPLGYAALNKLKSHPSINAAQIGIMGFSLGGQLSMRTTTTLSRSTWTDDDKGFAAHIGFYPGCKYVRNIMTDELTGAPILILAGSKDSYGDGEACLSLRNRVSAKSPVYIEVKIYDDVHHGFNLPGINRTITDRAAVTPGKQATLEWDPSAAEDSKARVVDFLKKAFGLGGAVLEAQSSALKRLSLEEANNAIDAWLNDNQQLCEGGADAFKERVSEHVEKLKSDKTVPSNLRISNFKLKFLHRKFCS